MPALNLIPLFTSSGASAGLSKKTRSHSCLITRGQVVSFRNQYGDSWFDASTTRGGGKHLGHWSMIVPNLRETGHRDDGLSLMV